jgi:L-seryl-tRNA(Ser) seleniumtransferase
MNDKHPPSVDKLARSLANTGLPHPVLVDIAREAIAAGDPDSAAIRTQSFSRQLLQPVVNATGVLLHTNLGRSPFGVQLSGEYTNLEFDLATGDRGSRQSHAGRLLAKLCGAEKAIVVNNCAASVMLVLAALADGKGVAVSRGEMVEIGGGFRVPEVMEQSGARLVEVGTTNRTRRADYERALRNDPDVALVMKIHQSNYKIVGFTEEASITDLVGLGVPVVGDIGSGLLDASCPWLPSGPPAWLANEPAAKQTLEAGANLITFSGDKILGGPQAGIIAGDADLVDACARHPLARALRPGGLVLRALQDVALTYLNRDYAALPFWAMATTPVADLRARAEKIGVGTVVDLMAVPGGGTLPGIEIPSVGLAIEGDHVEALRLGTDARHPIIARVREGVTELDLRTVNPDDDTIVEAALRSLN